jgi:5'-nucleotidase
MSARSSRRSRLTAAAAAAALVVSAGVTGSASAVAAPQKPAFTLHVLFTNDAESALLGVDGDGSTDEGPIVDDGPRPYGSASRMVALAKKLRAEATRGKPPAGQAAKRGVLTLSGGDNFLAGPEFAASLDKGVPFYDSLAHKAMGYDLSIVGNHEFDFGPEVTAQFIDGFRGTVPFVSANLDVSGEPALQSHADRGTIVATHVVKIRGERVGVIGLTTPELPSVSSPRNVKVDPDLAGIANWHAGYLEAKGVNKILLVSHLQDIDNELALVPKLRGVDAVIGAGGGEILADEGDRLIPGDQAERGFPLWATDAQGKKVPVVTTTGDYKYLGRLVLNFDRNGTVIGIDEEQTQPVRVSGVGPDAIKGDRKVREQVEKPVADYIEGLADKVVADSAVALDGVRNNVRSKETNLGNLMADALLWAGKQQAAEYGVPEPQVSIQNGGGIRNDSVIPTGPVTALNTYEIAPFANFVAVVPDVPRETLKQLLERGVAAAPDASGAFMQVGGLRFTYDTSKQAQVVEPGSGGTIVTPGERVQEVVLDDGTVIVENGQVVDGPPVTIATNDFSARGGDDYPFGGLPFTPVGITYQGALEQYLTDGLSGKVTAEDYPEGGEGRITPIN